MKVLPSIAKEACSNKSDASPRPLNENECQIHFQKRISKKSKKRVRVKNNNTTVRRR